MIEPMDALIEWIDAAYRVAFVAVLSIAVGVGIWKEWQSRRS